MIKFGIFHKKTLSKEARFKQVFMDMYPRLVRYATQLMGDGDEARDIVGDVMETAWIRFEQLDEKYINSWLYTATRNACLNRMKHLNVEQQYIEWIAEATNADVATDYMEHELLLQAAEKVARELDEPTCTILRLCYWEKKTYKETAEQLGISPDTVKKHISKALRILRERMKVED